MRYIIGLLCFVSVVFSQITDKNFKDKAGSGFVVVKFTSEWQEKDLDEGLFKGVKGHEDAIIIEAKSSDVKKICKKLRIRNYPSIALFMDGEVDIEVGDINSAIDDVLAEDVF